MKVLWLCSWYPSSADPYDGDFVERHARSLALHNYVDVIHIPQTVHLLKNRELKNEAKEENNLHAQINYIPFRFASIKPVAHLFYNLSYYSNLYSTLKKYIREKGMPDLVHVHVPVKMGAGAIWLKQKFNIPFVVTEHSTVYIKESFDRYEKRSWYFRSSTKKVFEQADAVFSVSMYHRKLLEQLFNLKGKPYIIRNAVDVKMFYPVHEINQVKRFVHVSMMFPFKNVEGILNALALLNQTNSNWQMQFIGPSSEEYRQLATTLGLDKQVEWKGTLSYTEVARHMQAADALVHFSHYENLPCVVNEALCCGIPVISSDVGGISELITETNGILVEKNNTKQLAEALNYFLQNADRFNKNTISAEAAAQFNYSVIGKQMIDLYKEVLGN